MDLEAIHDLLRKILDFMAALYINDAVLFERRDNVMAVRTAIKGFMRHDEFSEIIVVYPSGQVGFIPFARVLNLCRRQLGRARIYISFVRLH